MAGYVMKHVGHVYNGDSIAFQPMVNGDLVILDGDPLTAHASPGGDQEFRVVEKTTLWGMPAVILDVLTLGNTQVHFVENEWEVSPDAQWDEAMQIIPKGARLRVKRLLPGERIIMSIQEGMFNGVEVGDSCHAQNLVYTDRTFGGRVPV